MQGVHYAGPNPHPRQAAQAAATRSIPGRGPGSLRAWESLVREARGAEGRVVISSEWFSDAAPMDAQRIVEDLGAARTHVVVTLRPLDVLLPSQWQQFVQGGVTIPYEQWLRSIFDEPASGTAKRFWHRHRHDELIERWAGIVGRDRVTAVVVDDRDHAAVLRVFERLVGLREGTLELIPDRSNRSLTRPEAALIGAMNGALAGVGLDGQRRLDLVLYGAAANLKLRVPHGLEPRITTPRWALARAAEAAVGIVEGIRGSGVRVVGELDRLLVGTAATPSGQISKGEPLHEAAGAVWPAVVATGLLGVLTATGLARSAGHGADVEPFSSQRLRSIVLGRVRDAVMPS